jgi:hypothetical protein
MQKVHPRWKRIRLKNGETKRIKITPEECQACKKRCAACGKSFTVSTADDERKYCSIGCERLRRQTQKPAP